jgi:hypothetical protein
MIPLVIPLWWLIAMAAIFAAAFVYLARSFQNGEKSIVALQESNEKLLESNSTLLESNHVL